MVADRLAWRAEDLELDDSYLPQSVEELFELAEKTEGLDTPDDILNWVSTWPVVPQSLSTELGTVAASESVEEFLERLTVYGEHFEFHLKGKHNQKAHGGSASTTPDVTDVVRTKNGSIEGRASEYQNYKGEDWLKLDVDAKKKWHKVDDLEVVKKGAGVSDVDSSTKAPTPKAESKSSDRVSIGGQEYNVTERVKSKGEDWVKIETSGKKKWYKADELDQKSASTTSTKKSGSSSSDMKTSFDDLVKNPSVRADHDKQMESQRQSHSQEVSSKLTQRERDTLYSYTATQALSEDVNGTLRYAPTRNKHADILESQGYDRDTVSLIDSAIAKAPLPQNTRVYRGVGSEFVENRLSSAAVGTRFTDYGYASTSTNSQIAQDFAGYKGAVMVIDVPKGYKMLPMTHTAHQNEHEYLLPRGATFQIVKVSQSTSGGTPTTFVHVTVVEE